MQDEDVEANERCRRCIGHAEGIRALRRYQAPVYPELRTRR